MVDDLLGSVKVLRSAVEEGNDIADDVQNIREGLSSVSIAAKTINYEKEGI